MIIRKWIAVIILVLPAVSKAQTIMPATLNSAGHNAVVNNIYLEGSAGEVFSAPLKNTFYERMITQGFQQPGTESTITLPPPTPLMLSSVGIDNAGNSVIAGNIFLESTFGEMATLVYATPNNMLTQGILQPYTLAEGPLPVTGLLFTAKRINKQQVQLDWKTIQEISNKGFSVERKFNNQNSFDSITFVKSKSPDGSSSFPLEYVFTDNNSYPGNSYYRLKQEDINGQYTYSVIRIVSGQSSPEIVLKAWPIPNNGNFSFVAEGTDQSTVVSLLSADGRLVKRFVSEKNQVQQVNGLRSGAYLLKAEGMPVIKIIVQ